MTIGTRIEERRKAIGIKSQAELARRADIPQTSMNSLIKRPYRWSPHLPRIARELRTSIEYLVGETDDPAEGALPAPPPGPVVITMNVVLPPERALERMFLALLGGIGQKATIYEQARLLAQRLPIGLSQLRDLLPDEVTAARELEAATAGDPMPDQPQPS